MSYDVRVVEVAPGPLAVVRGVARAGSISPTVMELFDQVYRLLAGGQVQQDGQNVVVYLNAPDKNLLKTPDGCPIEVGVQVTAPFTDGGGLISSATPGGWAATVAHMGPYEQLGQAYQALDQWCAANHRTQAGPFWEVYGDWSDDPAQLRTDVYLLLVPGGEA